MSDLRITEAFLYMDYLRMSECIQISFAVCRIGIYTCFRALCCKGPPPARPEYDLVCIGLTGSGKTSLLSKLCSESPNSVVSTTGFSIKAVPFQNAILNVKELGGADNIRKYWSRYYQGSQGVIFVLDSASSEDDLETARNELHSALQHPQLCTLPFLILANHQDKPAARSVQEIRLFPQETAGVWMCVSMDLTILILFIYTLLSFTREFEVIDSNIDSDSGYDFM
uniref:ADP-ribosylation factor-like protein 15 n=1 Tax=Monodon monoceros TaxID=40151 RepID=A0A8C6AGI7_MONMO